jgi:SMODS and SLOG-associating 2TM effector domain family 5
MTDVKKELLNRMYKTKCARFNADNRLRLEYKLAHYSMMFISVCVVVLTLSQKFGVMFEHSDYISVSLSIFLIGIASFEAGNDRQQEAYLLHENALQISTLWEKSQTNDDIDQIAKDYSDIKEECRFNHTLFDYNWHVLNNNELPLKQRISAGLYLPLGIIYHYGIFIFIFLSPFIAYWSFKFFSLR